MDHNGDVREEGVTLPVKEPKRQVTSADLRRRLGTGE
jgi:hypothetical protein